MDDLLKQLEGVTFKRSEDGKSLEGTTSAGLPVTIHKQHDRIWLEVTVFDEELDDGRELEFEIKEA